MDQLDAKIIELLKENSRAKFVDIGKAVDLTEGAVRRRIKNLIKSGIIRKFSIETQSGAEAIVLIKTKPKTTPALTREVVKGLKRVAEKVFEVSGDFDIAASITAANIEELNQKVDEIRKFPHVQSTNTLIRLISA
jgi:Lrp/AsnC family transcriptional regulator of lysine biosynthesis